MNLANEPVRAYTKDMQIHSASIRPNQRQMGEIRQSVRKAVKQRSQGLCEVRKRCNGDEAVHMAHIIGRKQLKHRTTADDILHSCVSCHKWLDEHPEGIKFKRELRGEAI